MSIIGAKARMPLFWILMVAAQVGGFVLFKDLADISQWVVQSERSFTMAIWYNRWPIAIATLAALFFSIYLWRRQRSIASKKVIWGLVLFCLLNWYSGMVNTFLMFRPQQFEGQALFVTNDQAPSYLKEMIDASYDKPEFDSIDEIEMLVLETDQGARAYADYYLLQPHVVKGGTVKGEEVIMTYCGLTNMGIAYSPIIDGEPLKLRVMTQLRNNLVMWDMNSGEPVQQFWGSKEKDGEHGPAMKEFPTLRMPYSSFRKLYPNGKVFVNNIEQQSTNPLVRLWDTIVRDGMMLHAIRTLQWQTDKPAFPTIKEFDDRLPVKELIYGINVDDDYVAYTKEFVAQQNGPLNVAIGGKALVLYYDADLDSLAAFYNTTEHAITKVDVFGMSDQGQLTRVETLKSRIFWFIWRDFYKRTDINRA